MIDWFTEATILNEVDDSLDHLRLQRARKLLGIKSGGIAQPYIEFSQAMPSFEQKINMAQERIENLSRLADEKYDMVHRIADAITQVGEAHIKLVLFHLDHCPLQTHEADECTRPHCEIRGRRLQSD